MCGLMLCTLRSIHTAKLVTCSSELFIERRKMLALRESCICMLMLCNHAGAADMTMQDVSTHYNEVVRELSLNLALHDAAQRHATEAGGAGEWPLAGYKPWQNIRAAFDRWAAEDVCRHSGYVGTSCMLV